MKLAEAAVLVSRGMKVLQAAPAAYPYRSVEEEKMPVCARHGEQGFHAFACREVCIAVGAGGLALDVTWWECGLDGQELFASLLCAGCIATYQLPPSPASLDDPQLSEDVPHNLLAVPICMRCFEEWRQSRGVMVAGPYPKIPANWYASHDTEQRTTKEDAAL